MDLVNQFIATSLAIKVFRRDKELFADFKFFELYQAKLDKIIEVLVQDFNNLRKDMYTVHHIDIKKISGTKYRIRGKEKIEVIEYTPEQLKQMTSTIMNDYLLGKHKS
ncbi:hypothetical protein NSQ77_20040 [Oceanobacillus sp. FSL K6-2867]|uniref:hypothetical protein n=1 Tax=Oceanobacillus sp. FSL K6-2867 TaxID=2954748 RepID=UPI0030DBCE64